jgi:hypothetical protein
MSRIHVAVSLLNREQPVIESGYAWLVSEARQHDDSSQTRGAADLLEKFDELVAAEIVSGYRLRGARWSLRATGEVVLNVLDQTGILEDFNSPVAPRELVVRAHEIARQIVPQHSGV